MGDDDFRLPWGDILGWRGGGLTIAATDGCFDLLHAGHLRMLTWARGLADRLVVLLPDDASVAAAKPGRPFVPLAERMELVAGLRPVDAVGSYAQAELAGLYARLRPDVLVNSPEWRGRVVGQAEVEARGGRIAFFPEVAGLSTTGIASRIRGA